MYIHFCTEVNFIMEITKEDLVKTAENARLHLTDEELETYTTEVNRIVSYVKKIQAINTDDIEATTHGNTVKDVLRKDEPVKWELRDQALENAPEIEDDHFKVPTVIE